LLRDISGFSPSREANLRHLQMTAPFAFFHIIRFKASQRRFGRRIPKVDWLAPARTSGASC
jgi:hypothetical protein